MCGLAQAGTAQGLPLTHTTQCVHTIASYGNILKCSKTFANVCKPLSIQEWLFKIILLMVDGASNSVFFINSVIIEYIYLISCINISCFTVL